MFAASVGRAIGNWNGSQSLVVALFGGWGTGKTSIKNLALAELASSGSAPTVMQFNPWLVGSDDKLIEAFMRDVTIAIGRQVPGESAEKAEKRLAKVAPYFTLLGSAAEKTCDLLALAVPGAKIASIVAKGLSGIGEAIQSGSEAEKQIAEAASLTLAEVKASLHAELRKRELPLLVVVDDIDRLTQDEICTLFRLVKANADFPNFIYLLLCDRKVVVDALEHFAPGHGSEFLEKIVQVSFDVPPVDTSRLKEIAKKEWKTLRRSLTKRHDDTRTEELLDIAVPYLNHVRSLRRWMNSVYFAAGLFKGGSGLEVNTEDLLGVELLRVFEPQLYEKVAQSGEVLAINPSDFREQIEDIRKEHGKARDLLLEVVPERRRATVARLLCWLFPIAWRVPDVPTEGELLRELRVAHPECFSRYFRMSIVANAPTRRELRQAVTSAGSYSKFLALVNDRRDPDAFLRLAHYLLAQTSELSGHVPTIVQVLFDAGDELPAQVWTFGGEATQATATELVLHLLRTLGDRQARTAALLDCIKKAKGLMLPVFVVASESSQTRRRQYSESELVIAEAALPKVHEATRKKIEQFQHSTTMTPPQTVGFVLELWRRWGGTNEAQTWVASRLTSDDGVWQMLRSAANSETGGGETRYTGISIEWLTKFVSPAAFHDRLAEVRARSSDTQHRILVELFDRDYAAHLAKVVQSDISAAGGPS